ncbi:MAG: hypothetical protein MUO77_16020, partial [Anaerolineales bacterium]|nr:hypothetical protein [Anaerolineales bacterium]
TDEAIQWLAQKGYDTQLGARPLIRLIDRELLNEIGGLLLVGHLKTTHVVQISLKDNKLQIDRSGVTTIE